MRLPIRWMIRCLGVAALAAVTHSVAPAQTNQPQIPSKNEGKTPGPAHPATGSQTGGTKTPATAPHPTVITPHPSTAVPGTATPHPGTTTISPTGTTATVITPNSTTTISPNSTTTHGTNPTSARVTLPPYNPSTIISSNPFLSTRLTGNSIGVQPFLNNSPYYQLSLQNSLRSPSPYATDPYLAINNFYSPFANPYVYYSLMNPYSAFNNPFNPLMFGTNPFMPVANPFNPLLNPFAPANNPFFAFANPLNPLNPFALNPFMANLAAVNQGNPFLAQGLNANPFGFFGPGLAYTPPVAVQQPGVLLREGPNLAVNPVTGTVVLPMTGIATMADGSTFYRLPSGLTQSTSPVYYNPVGGTFFNPLTGVVARPGQVNAVVP